MNRPSRAQTGAPAEPLVLEQRRLGRYDIMYRVARGGMAAVYLARLSATQGFAKWVAIKTIHAHVADEPRYIGMFLDEAKLAARINHPNVCTVFDFGESDGIYYLAMEYLHGQALSSTIPRALAKGGLPTSIGARIVADAARGLHAAHELRDTEGNLAGVVHRDVSPQNIFVLYDGIAKVVDFGIAKSNEQTGERTHTTELKGKIAYMAPEQIAHAPLDRRADLWALGVVLWEATTGRRLFHRANEIATLNAVAYEAVPPPSTVRADYPADLEAIVMRALDRDPLRRYQTAAEMARDLEVHLATLASPVTNTEVGMFMQAIFRDEIRAREDALRAREREGASMSGAQPVASSVAALASSVPSLERSTHSAETLVAAPTPAQQAETAVAPIVANGSASNPSARFVPTPPTFDPPPPRTDAPPSAFGPLDLVASPLLPPAPLPAKQRGSDGRGWLLTCVGVAVMGLGGYVVYAHLHAVEPTASVVALPSPTADVVVAPIADASLAIAPTANPEGAPIAMTHLPAVPSAETRAAWHLPNNAGALDLVTMPAARVFERGRLLGVTPLTRFAMRPGTHALRLVPENGRPAREITVTIRRGQSTALREVW
jgi:serine/threonine-protein kinase